MGNQLYGHVHVIYLPSSEHIKIIIKSIIKYLLLSFHINKDNQHNHPWTYFYVKIKLILCAHLGQVIFMYLFKYKFMNPL